MKKIRMNTIWVFAAICLCTKITTPVFAQAKSIPAPPPDKIVLLPGYTSTRDIGGDSYSGTFSKPGGVSVKFDIGQMAGDAAKYGRDMILADDKELYQHDKEPSTWYKKQTARGKEQETVTMWLREQTVQGQRVEILMVYPSSTLVISFPDSYANFSAYPKSDSDLVDILLMVLTYTPPGPKVTPELNMKK